MGDAILFFLMRYAMRVVVFLQQRFCRVLWGTLACFVEANKYGKRFHLSHTLRKAEPKSAKGLSARLKNLNSKFHCEFKFFFTPRSDCARRRVSEANRRAAAALRP